MPHRNTARAAAIGAILFAVAFFVGFGMQPGNAPNSGDSGAQVIQWAADHRGRLLVSLFIIACSSIPFVLLVAALHRLMRRVEGPDGWLSTAMLVSGVISTGAFLAGVGLLGTLVYRPVTSAPVARMLMDGGFITFNFSGIPLAAFVAAISAAALLHRLVPAWVGWLGIPVAALQVIAGGALAKGDAAFSPQGPIALIGAISVAVWILVLAAGLVVVSRRSTLTA